MQGNCRHNADLHPAHHAAWCHVGSAKMGALRRLARMKLESTKLEQRNEMPVPQGMQAKYRRNVDLHLVHHVTQCHAGTVKRDVLHLLVRTKLKLTSLELLPGMNVQQLMELQILGKPPSNADLRHAHHATRCHAASVKRAVNRPVAPTKEESTRLEQHRGMSVQQFRVSPTSGNCQSNAELELRRLQM